MCVLPRWGSSWFTWSCICNPGFLTDDVRKAGVTGTRIQSGIILCMMICEARRFFQNISEWKEHYIYSDRLIHDLAETIINTSRDSKLYVVAIDGNSARIRHKLHKSSKNSLRATIFLSGDQQGQFYRLQRQQIR
jgi:hypothetical protein